MNTVKNLEILLHHIKQVPEAELNLEYYRKDTPCGTLFCVAGEVTNIKHFQDMGFYLKEYNIRDVVHYGFAHKDSDSPVEDKIMDPIFGQFAYGRLFDRYGEGYFDGAILSNELVAAIIIGDRFDKPITDKALAIARIERQIELVGGE